jgi:enamine deaminase RidA (YjgF/YER057c/UK114 family)
MSHIEERLHELGVTLPSSPAPFANYVPAKRVGNLVFTAGQGSGEYKGKLGATLSIEEGRAATRACVINCLAAIKSLIGHSILSSKLSLSMAWSTAPWTLMGKPSS